MTPGAATVSVAIKPPVGNPKTFMVQVGLAGRQGGGMVWPGRKCRQARCRLWRQLSRSFQPQRTLRKQGREEKQEPDYLRGVDLRSVLCGHGKMGASLMCGIVGILARGAVVDPDVLER